MIKWLSFGSWLYKRRIDPEVRNIFRLWKWFSGKKGTKMQTLTALTTLKGPQTAVNGEINSIATIILYIYFKMYFRLHRVLYTYVHENFPVCWSGIIRLRGFKNGINVKKSMPWTLFVNWIRFRKMKQIAIVFHLRNSLESSSSSR